MRTRLEGGLKAHAVKVTPEMRESVLQGQVMFSRVSADEMAKIRAYDKYYNTNVEGFLNYVVSGWDGTDVVWKVARIKSTGFPTLVDAAKHGNTMRQQK